VTDTVDFGLPGVAVSPGDHICGFFYGVDENPHFLSPDEFRLTRS
jgi:hypothetical protein